jgi:hypothetical protein
MQKSKTISMGLTMLGLSAATSFAEIKINENLSTSGFLDMSVSGYAPDSGDATLGASFDQFELDFMYKFGNVSARADVNATPAAWNPGAPMADTSKAGTSSAVYLEQGFVNYAMGAGGITVGRFLSSSGYEAAEPTGMFQYSYSKTLVYGYYQNGLALNYGTNMFALYGAVVSDLWNPQEFELANSPGFEGQVSLMPVEGVTAKVAYLYQIYDNPDDESQSLLNAWVQYAKNALTVAGEFNLLTDWAIAGTPVTDASGMGWLALVNYKFTDKIATTVRYSGIKFEDADDPDTEVTLSPSYAVSPNWLVLAEVKQEIDVKKTNYAVESTFSF